MILRRLSLSLFAAVTLASCNGDDEPSATSPSGSGDHPGEGSEQIEEPGTRRTILIYMLASNSLGTPGGGYDYKDMEEMERWSAQHSLNGCNVVVVRIENSSTPTPEVMRLVGGDLVVERTLEPLDGCYATQPEVMREIFRTVRADYPADEYALVLWSHGTTWAADSGTLPYESPRRSWGDDRGRRMSIRALADAVADPEFAPWSFIFFDSCYGANIETFWEMRDASRWLLGSTTETPAPGMPYQLTLTPMTASVFHPEEVTGAILEYYSTGNYPCTISAVDTSALPPLADAVADIMASGAKLPAGSHGVQDYTSNIYIIRYLGEVTGDMRQYMHALEGTTPEQLQRFDRALSDAVASHGANTLSWGSYNPSLYCGLGAYVITDLDKASSLGYMELEWWTDVMSLGTY